MKKPSLPPFRECQFIPLDSCEPVHTPPTRASVLAAIQDVFFSIGNETMNLKMMREREYPENPFTPSVRSNPPTNSSTYFGIH
jgi:hypothetical protein